MPKFSQAIAENIVRNGDSGIYYLQAKINGKKIRKSLRTSKLKIAKMKRDDMLRKLRARSPDKDSKNMTLKDCIELTRSYYSEKPSYKVKPASMHYRNQCLSAIESEFPNRAISTISKKETHDAFARLAARYSAQRYNNILGTFREMMRIAIRAHARLDDPSAELERLPIRKKEIEIPLASAFAEIVKSVRSQNKANSIETANFIEFLAYSGMRVDEARNVFGADIGKDRIKVTGGASGTKNHQVRYVPIVPAMQDLLKRMQYGIHKPLFRVKSPRGALKNACARLGINHVRVHDLRHFFATTCVESGIDFATIAKWLGHKDGGILVARTYGHIRDEHSQREAAKVRF